MKVSRRKKNIVVLDSGIGKVNRTTRMFVSREEVRRKQAGIAVVVMACAFAVMLALFGSISVLTEIARPEIENQLPGVSADAAQFDDDDAMTIAVIRDDDDGVPEQLMLVRFEASEERIYVTGLPLETEVDEKTLMDYYKAGGIKSLRAALEVLVDCSSVYTLRYDYVQTRKLINYFDGVTITLDYGISYQSPDGNRNVNVVAGTRLYTGWEIARLLDYPGWEGGREEQLSMYTYVLEQFLDQNFRNFDEQKLQKFYAHVCAYSENDISTSEFHAANAGLLHISSLPVGERTMRIDAQATKTADGNYLYEGDELVLLRAAFGDRDPEEKE